MAHKNLLERHRIEFHSENKPHKCHHCNLSFRWVNQLNYHIKTHENDLVECQICGKNTDTRSKMDHHLDYDHFKDKLESLVKEDSSDWYVFVSKKLKFKNP